MVPSIISGSRRKFGIALLLLLVAAVILAGLLISTNVRANETRLKIGSKEYVVQVVSSQEDREKGLSGSRPLPPSRGMLFVFPRTEKWGIWMKDMSYPLDILWFDESKQVVDMVEAASPDSYPETTFEPNKPARYILELKSGSIDEASISIGSQAEFDVDSSGGKK